MQENINEVTVAKIKELRDRTGMGLMDCRKALMESGGSIDEAVKYFCQKGLASSDKTQEKDAIHVLQERTGSDYKNCKQALIECEGNIEKALKYLSEQGQVLLESEFLIWQDNHDDYIAYINRPVNVSESYRLGLDDLDVTALAVDVSGQDTCPVLLWTSSGDFTVVQDSIKEFLEDLVPYSTET